MIIDALLPQAESLIDYALTRTDIGPAPGLYPGLRAPAPALYEYSLRSALNPLLDWFGIGADRISEVKSWFSVVTTPAEQLGLMQQIPHFDRPEPDHLAVLHYLCDETFGGTSFYRHRTTGFEYIDAGRMTPYLERVRSEAQAEIAKQPPAYINGSTRLFERIASVDCRFNRALVYRCTSLHSGNIAADYRYDVHPRTGRFTVASFISVRGT